MCLGQEKENQVIEYTAAQLIRLTLFALLIAVGQVLFKKASLETAPFDGWRSIITLGLNFWFILAICIYMSTTLLWVSVLREMPLSRAYPFTVIGFILVPVAGHLLFAEVLNARYFLGAFLIIIGVYLASGAT